tara:strand:- start:4489 stop:4647 length:159 start_codon:yes stop_codon:yes gene_type:complete
MTLRTATKLEEAIFKIFWDNDEDSISEKTWVDGAFDVERLFKKYKVETPYID